MGDVINFAQRKIQMSKDLELEWKNRGLRTGIGQVCWDLHQWGSGLVGSFGKSVEAKAQEKLALFQDTPPGTPYGPKL